MRTATSKEAAPALERQVGQRDTMPPLQLVHASLKESVRQATMHPELAEERKTFDTQFLHPEVSKS